MITVTKSSDGCTAAASQVRAPYALTFDTLLDNVWLQRVLRFDYQSRTVQSAPPARACPRPCRLHWPPLLLHSAPHLSRAAAPDWAQRSQRAAQAVLQPRQVVKPVACEQRRYTVRHKCGCNLSERCSCAMCRCWWFVARCWWHLSDVGRVGGVARTHRSQRWR